MATENDTPDAETKTPSEGGLLKLIVLALVCAGASFGAVYFLSPSATSVQVSCADTSVTPPKSQSLASDDQIYIEMKDLLVTIGNEPATRYIKMKTSIITDKAASEKVKKAEPMLADAFVGYLRALELTDFESADFYPELREQLSHRSEVVLGGDVSQGVLITEFLLR